jgi:hypothetical protein
MVAVFGMRIRLELRPDGHGRAKATEVPSRKLKHRKFPTMIPEVIRSHPFEKFTICHDGPKPRFARKNIIKRVLEHPHVYRAYDGREVLKRDLGHIGDLVHVTDHNDGGAWNVLKAPHDALALILLARPGVWVGGRLRGRDDNVRNFVKPFGVPLLIRLEKELFGPTDVIHLGFNEDESVDPFIEDREAELEQIKLVIKHKRVHDHGLYL